MKEKHQSNNTRTSTNANAEMSTWKMRDLGESLWTFGTEIVTTSTGAFSSVFNFAFEDKNGTNDKNAMVWKSASARDASPNEKESKVSTSE
jgi:hypothetical protein